MTATMAHKLNSTDHRIKEDTIAVTKERNNNIYIINMSNKIHEINKLFTYLPSSYKCCHHI